MSSSAAEHARARRYLASLLAAGLLLAGCGETAPGARRGAASVDTSVANSQSGDAPTSRAHAKIPPLLDSRDVYAADRAGELSPAVRGDPSGL